MPKAYKKTNTKYIIIIVITLAIQFIIRILAAKNKNIYNDTETVLYGKI